MKNVLIIGARGGIGSAITKIFQDDKNFNLYITASSKEGVDDFIIKNLKTEDINSRVFGFNCNLLNYEEVESLFLKVLEKAKKIDILICNAGLNNDKLAIRMQREDFNQVIQANLVSNFILNREAIKHMIKNNFGRIINIASIIGETGNAGQANYAASKAGLIAMSKSLAIEYANRNITINCVSPGFIESDMTNKIPEQIKQTMLDKIPMKKYGQPLDIASIVYFLASDKSSYITGQNFHINGGMLMK